MRRPGLKWLLGLVCTLAAFGAVSWYVFGLPSMYLRNAFSILENNAYYSSRVNWPAVRERCSALARDAKEIAATYPAIQCAIQALDDHHTFFMPPMTPSMARMQNEHSPSPAAHSLEGDVGYIELPGLLMPNKLFDGREYADALQAEVRRVDSPRRCAWIVDLRANTGGHSSPMLAAIGFLLGEGEIGAFVFADGRRIGWTYRDGELALGGNVQGRVSGSPLEARGDVPVAVLYGPKTASAGEAVAVAFRGRANTRAFGEPTFGVPTMNRPHLLRDGAALVVMEALEADRTGRVYDGKLLPDESASGEETLKVARRWLSAQPACQAHGNS